MKVYILRHGEAEAPITSDSERRLTARGRKQIEKIFSMVGDELSSVEKIYASPYVRAQETAGLMSKFLKTVNPNLPEITTTSDLVPESSLIKVMTLLESASAESILLVSHQPLVGELVNRFCSSPSGYQAMGTGNLACIELDVSAFGCGNFLWLKMPAG